MHACELITLSVSRHTVQCFLLILWSRFLDGSVTICLRLMVMLMIICHFCRYYLTIIQSGSLLKALSLYKKKKKILL